MGAGCSATQPEAVKAIDTTVRLMNDWDGKAAESSVEPPFNRELDEATGDWALGEAARAESFWREMAAARVR